MPPTPLIMDVDTGVDDALALLLALASPEVELVGVSTVAGNVPLSRTTDNTLRLLQWAGRADVPVYAGAERPLVRDAVVAADVHGATGLGAAQLPEAHTAPAGDGVEFLLNALQTRPGRAAPRRHRAVDQLGAGRGQGAGRPATGASSGDYGRGRAPAGQYRANG